MLLGIIALTAVTMAAGGVPSWAAGGMDFMVTNVGGAVTSGVVFTGGTS